MTSVTGRFMCVLDNISLSCSYN